MNVNLWPASLSGTNSTGNGELVSSYSSTSSLYSMSLVIITVLTSASRFPHINTDCISSCDNRRSCKVPVTEHVFGEYPCEEQTRYLEVTYTCAKPPTAPPPPPAPLKPDCTYEG